MSRDFVRPQRPKVAASDSSGAASLFSRPVVGKSHEVLLKIKWDANRCPKCLDLKEHCWKNGTEAAA